jgi:hypothetical protein
MRSHLKRLDALEAAAAASSGAGLRSIIFVPVRPVLNEEGQHIGGMRGDRGSKDCFKPGGGTAVTIRHSAEKPKFSARPGCTVEQVEARAVELGFVQICAAGDGT